ncbi:hypothetical protein GCM10017782_08170 [Deinococcus ficus]|nr:hypothetical protein GCM10017782_08170 [Deinococcus ficus]
MENRIRELRTELRWTQADLAAALDVSRQTVNALETGKYDPSLPLAFRIARLFGQPLEQVFHDPNGPPQPWLQASRPATPDTDGPVLHRMGLDGWELIGVAPDMLHFRRPAEQPAQQWAYDRLDGDLPAGTQAERARSGWAYVASWPGRALHYFKRPTG